MKTNQYLTVLFLFLLSCGGKDKSAVKSSYDAFNRYVGNQQMIKAIEIIDSSSQTYFEDVAKLVNGATEDQILKYCNSLEVPFATRFLIQQGELVRKKERGDLNALQIAQLSNRLNMGIFGVSAENSIYKFIDVSVMSKEQANVSVSQSVDSMANVVSRFMFTNEMDQWLVNIPSTFKLQDKILRAKWKASGKTARRFMNAYIENEEYSLSNIKYKK